MLWTNGSDVLPLSLFLNGNVGCDYLVVILPLHFEYMMEGAKKVLSLVHRFLY